MSEHGPEDAGTGEGKRARTGKRRDHKARLPRRSRDHRGRARHRRGRATPDGRRGRARGDQPALGHRPAAGLLPADRDRPHRRDRPRRAQHDAHRPAGRKPKDIHSTKRRPRRPPARPGANVDNDYDCVIVGAGASGLGAAKFYRDRFGPDTKILLIDQLPDFGGNSHRNEFHVPDAFRGGADVMTLRNGGTVNLDSIGAWNKPQGGLMDIPGSYGQPAVDILGWAGVDYSTATSGRTAARPGIPSSFGPAPDAALPGRGVRRHRHGDPEPHRAEHGGRLDDVHGADAVLGRGAAGDHRDPDRRTRT